MKQPEVMHHHPIPDNHQMIELIYYCNIHHHDQIIQQYLDTTTSSTITATTMMTTTSDTSTNTIMIHPNTYDIPIYKESKLYTSVGIASYTCPPPPDHTTTTNINNNDKMMMMIRCHVQFEFFSSNTVTNQTINTLQIQSLFPVVSSSSSYSYDNNNNNNDNDTVVMTIIGGTWIYHGANGQAILRYGATYTVKVCRLYKYTLKICKL